MKSSGIYEIRNLTNGKRYIGSAVNFDKRWKAHIWKLNKGQHHAPHLQASWKKYGGGGFVFEPLLICAKENLTLYEQIVIERGPCQRRPDRRYLRRIAARRFLQITEQSCPLLAKLIC